MSFEQEQALIDKVHSPIDAEILDEIENNRHYRRERMLQAMRDQDLGLASELIRNVDNRFIFVRGGNLNEDEKLQRFPWYYDGFSLTPGMVHFAFKSTRKLDYDTDKIPWLMQTPTVISDPEAPSNQPSIYRWTYLEDESAVYRSSVVAVHPCLVKYDQDLGFRFELSDGTFQSPPRLVRKQWEHYVYQAETFSEHVKGLYDAYRSGKGDHKPLQEEIAFTVNRLENSAKFRLWQGALDKMFRAMFACHDLGKLNIQWQSWAHIWQEKASQILGEDLRLPQDYMAAHTDYDPRDKEQRRAQKEILPRRPNHAAESAIAGARVLQALSKNNEALLRAALTAVTRHHSPRTVEGQPYKLHLSGKVAIRISLDLVKLNPDWAKEIVLKSGQPRSIRRYLIRYDARVIEELLLYFLLVRVLRLADQRSQID